MRIHHAPWSRRFKTMWFKGSFAYELQVGPLVFQWFYEPITFQRRVPTWYKGRRIHIWRDRYWNL